jgi:hypothetical protein
MARKIYRHLRHWQLSRQASYLYGELPMICPGIKHLHLREPGGANNTKTGKRSGDEKQKIIE